ncbi:MAG: SDR family oxidoreductase [Planctomycetota bacterium]
MGHETGPLAGRIILVTGAARRIGRAIALATAEAGADVVVHYRRSADEAADVAETIRRGGRQAWTLQADLADPDGAAAVIGRAVELAGPVDVLVNNASSFPAGLITEAGDADIIANVRVHAVAPLLLSRALAEQGRPGHIVNLLDARITDYDRRHAAYQLSKRMLADLTRMLAVELAPSIAVNAVAPGLILPPPGENESYLERFAHTNPLNRHGDPADIARAVLYLLGSTFVTGQILYVDGGRHMRGSMYGS